MSTSCPLRAHTGKPRFSVSGQKQLFRAYHEADQWQLKKDLESGCPSDTCSLNACRQHAASTTEQHASITLMTVFFLAVFALALPVIGAGLISSHERCSSLIKESETLTKGVVQRMHVSVSRGVICS